MPETGGSCKPRTTTHRRHIDPDGLEVGEVLTAALKRRSVFPMRWISLVCPETQIGLRRIGLAEAEEFCGSRLRAPVALGYTPVGRTPEVMVREDRAGAYPIQSNVPVLLAPEWLAAGDGIPSDVNIRDAQYAEAYEEMEHYSDAAAEDAETVADSLAATDLGRLMGLSRAQREEFPEPRELWLDAKYEMAAQRDAFDHLKPVDGASALQVGGRGLHAVKFLLAGAEQAWVVSPMVGEMLFAKALARHCGVEDRLHCVAAIAEKMPFQDQSFDIIYSQGCVHHWVIDLALPECSRVLRPGGRFAAVEPWRGPFYGIGTRVLGKRDTKVRCEVLTPARIGSHLNCLDAVQVRHHGTLTRYPLLGLWKFGVNFSRSAVWTIGRLDDSLSSQFPSLAAAGSSVAILGSAAVTEPSAKPSSGATSVGFSDKDAGNGRDK